MMNSQNIAKLFVKLSQYPNADGRIRVLIDELKKRRMLWILPNVRNELMRMRERDREHVLLVETSDPLSPEERNRIETLFGEHGLREVEREDLILGAEMYHKGKVYHGSVRWSLDQLKKRLSTLSKKVYED